MARFPDLPNEIILMISKYVQPQDLDNWFLTSKHIRQLHGEYVALHVSRKRHLKYINSRLVGTMFFPAEKVESWARLLSMVLLNARLASYVEELDIQGYHMSWATDARLATLETGRRDDMCSEENRKLFHEAIEKSVVIGDEASNWKQAYEDGREDQVLGHLLMLLPNLTAINLNFPDHEDSHLFRALANTGVEPESMLTRLTRVTLSSTDRQTSVFLVMTFAEIPSVRQLYAQHVTLNRADISPWFTHSNVKALSLTSCLAEPEALFEFLSAFESLTSFEYTNAEPLQRHSGSRYNPFWILKALHYHSRSSLERLILRGPQQVDPCNIMGSLASFPMLKELDTDLNYLINVGHLEYRSLTQVLPESMERLMLRHVPTPEINLYHMVHDVLGSRTSNFPYLEALTFRPDGRAWPSEDSFRQVAACEAAGIRLSFS